MNLSSPFIKRPVMTILVMLSLVFFGVLSYKKLPVSDLPDVDYPVIMVTAAYPGASPETMANNVATPLEKHFTSIGGIKSIASTSQNGQVSIVLMFDIDKDIQDAAQQVQAKITQASMQLPQDMPYAPTFERVNPSETPVTYFLLHSKTELPSKLYDMASVEIGRQINILDGVGQVQTIGSPYAVRVHVDPLKMRAHDIGIDELAAAIRSENVNLPTGVLYGDHKEFTIDVDGQLVNAEKYRDIIIKRNDDGAIIRLRDIGDAIDSLEQDKLSLRYYDKSVNEPCVIVGIKKQPGANTLAVCDRVETLLKKVEKSLPESVTLTVIHSKSHIIRESVADVKFTLALAVALVVLVVFLYLGKPLSTFIPAMAIPISILGTFATMSLLGYSIDILSLLAVTLSIGFLVDDAIVVLENIERHIEMGKSPFKAALDGSKEISFTILSMTTCLVAVFIPMLFMPDLMGKIFREFAATIMIAVAFSGFVSLTLTPLLCAKLLSNQKTSKSKLEHLSLALNKFLETHYEKGLIWAIKHRFTVFLFGTGTLVMTIFMFTVVKKDFLPTDDMGFIVGFTQASDATSIKQTGRFQDEVNKIANDSPYVEMGVSASGMPTDNSGFFFLRLKPLKERPGILSFIGEMQDKIHKIPGIQAFLKPLPLIDLQTGTSQSHGNYQYTLQSIDQHLLYEFAPKFQKSLSEIPGVTGVSSDLHMGKPQVKLDILRDKASFYNISAQDIESALGLTFAQANLSSIQLADDQYHVILEALPDIYNTPESLSQIYVRSQKSGKLVPLSEVTQISENLGPITVGHFNSLPAVTFSFNLSDVPLGEALDNIDKMATALIPKGEITGSVQGSADAFKKTFASLQILVLITIFIIYVVLGILYENFFDPITVMSTLPPAALGALLTLFIFRLPLSLYSFVGIIMLLGIVLKNGIIMIEFAAEAIENHKMHYIDAIKHACVTRFRPILMTTIAAMMGAVPIAIGVGGATADGRKPLGYAIVGGLIISQMLTLFLTPITYIYLEKLRHFLTKKNGPSSQSQR